jgi:hypothetical protein
LSASIKRPKSEHHGPKVVRRERGDSFELGKRHLDRHLAGERELARHAPDGDGGRRVGLMRGLGRRGQRPELT